MLEGVTWLDRIEQTVRRTNLDQKQKDQFRYWIRLALAIAFSVVAVLLLVSMFASLHAEGNTAFTTESLILLIPVLISSVIAAVFFVIKDSAIIEYDYAVIDDVLTVEKIRNLSSRKMILKVKVRNFKRLERFSRAELKKMRNKVTDCSLNSQKDKYFLYYEDDGKQSVLIFEPNDMFRDKIKKEFEHPSSSDHHHHHHRSGGSGESTEHHHHHHSDGSGESTEHHHHHRSDGSGESSGHHHHHRSDGSGESSGHHHHHHSDGSGESTEHHHHHHSDSEHTDTSSSDGEKK